MRASAAEPIHLEPTAAWAGVGTRAGGVSRETAAATHGRVTTTRGVPALAAEGFFPASGKKVVEGVMLLGIVWSIPAVILLVGTPIAFAIAFLLRVARLALSAF
jgi:hypothetical protein